MPRIIAKTLQALEEPLAAELRDLGAKDVNVLTRAVESTMDWDTLYRAHLHSRLALRFIQPIAEFEARDEKQFYGRARQVPFEKYMNVTDTLFVQPVVYSSTFTHSHFMALKLKDAICDRFRSKTGKRPSIDKHRPSVLFVLTIMEKTVHIALDATGGSLHRRGYRGDRGGEAPLNEVLAAGLLARTNWEPGMPLVDGMTGSGTFVVEALMRALKAPPSKLRDEYALQRWRGFTPDRWAELRAEALAQEEEGYPPILGLEVNDRQMTQAKDNLMRAGYRPIHHLKHMDFFDFTPRGHDKSWDHGVVVLNPPYDERMKHDDIEGLYSRIGDHLKQHFTGWDAWILTANRIAMKHIGLRTAQRVEVMNGKLHATWLHYPLYKGSRKEGRSSHGGRGRRAGAKRSGKKR